MQSIKIKKSPGYFDNLLWVGFGIGLFYWFGESALHVFIFQEGTVASQILPNDVHEIWKRSSVLVLIGLFSFYAQSRIIERRFKDKELKEMESKYRTLFEKGLIPIFLIDTRGHFIDFNRSALEFFECSPQRLKGKSIWDCSVTKYNGMPKVSFFPLLSQKSLEIDYSVNDKIKTLMINLVPYEASGQTVIYGIGQDITTRKTMEREILIAHTELNQIFQTASVGMRLIDQDFNVLKANETFSILSGSSVDASVGKKCYDEFKGEMCHTEKCSLIRIRNGEKDIECEVVKTRSDGHTVHCLLTARPFYGPSGDLKGIVESFKNINELKRIQEDLRNEHDKLRRILFHRFEGVGIVTSDFTIEYLNDALQAQHGDCQGHKCYSIFRERDYPCEDCIMHKAIASEMIWRNEFNASTGRIYEQTYTPFQEINGKKKVVISVRDVTEAKTAKAVAYRSEQLAALGELAAGVAHEINNPINGIINYAQILINKNSRDKEIHNIAGRIRKESNRVAWIVEKLLSFSSRERQSKIQISFMEILEESLSLIHSQMRKEAINIKKNIPSDLPQLYAAPQEIQQVFINILSNARYSLNKKYPKNNADKRIEINAESVNNDKTLYVRISFVDYGIGIPGNIINKILNPFFSTKPRGVGTGLGLSISHGIISEHGGKINIESRENQYTCVSIDLPSAPNHLS